MHVNLICVRFLVLTVLVLLGLSKCVKSQSKVGTSCIVKDTNKPGSCVLLRECSSAWKKLKDTNEYPQVCGHLGTVLIVCCPILQAERKVGDISKQKCKEYAKARFKKEINRTPLIGHNDPDDRIFLVEDCRMTIKTLVVGGEKAEEAEFPHMALIGYDPIEDMDQVGKQWNCGGSLISEQYVLTAGHCLYYFSGSPKYVRIGVTNIYDFEFRQDFNIIERIKHPDYDPPSHYNDIALVKMEKPAVFKPEVRPACLFTEDEKHISHRKVIATGWGQLNSTEEKPDDLQKVVLDFIDINTCNNYWKTSRNNNKLSRGIVEQIQVCAGSLTEKKDTCQGDSGGPLQVSNSNDDDFYCTYSVVGVTSFGKPCGQLQVPGIYTRVSAHLEWIENVVWPKESE